MNRIKTHIISQFASQLLVAAMAFTVLFGNGMHLHFSFHHLFEHGDFHIALHSHAPSDSDEHSNFGSEENESHHHPVATIEFNGTLSHNILIGVSSINDLHTGFLTMEDSNSGFDTIERFALPPPETVISHFITSSLSLRAPPAA